MASSHLIAPSGGDYTSLTLWNAAQARDLTGTGNAVARMGTFPGGLNDDTAFTGGWTTTASDRIVIQAEVGSEASFETRKAGFYFIDAGNTLRPVSGADHIDLIDLEFDRSTANIPSIIIANGGGGFFHWQRLVFDGGNAGDTIFLLSGPNIKYDNVLIVNPADDGYIGNGIVDHMTVVNAGNRGVVTTGGSMVNSFVIGSTGVDFSNQGGTHDYNATEDATAPGANSLTGRSFADFVNSGTGDYRTAAASALATAGNGTFIGSALEVGGGPTFTLIGDTSTNATTANNSGLLHERLLGLAPTSYATVASDSGLLLNLVLQANSIAYSTTANPTALMHDRLLALDTAAFVTTANAATFFKGRMLSVDTAVFTTTANDASFKYDRVLAAATASYTTTANDATLTYFPSGGPTYELIAASVAFNTTVSDAALLKSAILQLDTASYTTGSNEVGLRHGRSILVDSANFNTTANDSLFGRGYVARIDTTEYVTIASDAILTFSGLSVIRSTPRILFIDDERIPLLIDDVSRILEI